MKHLSPAQIEQVKNMNPYRCVREHGNRKTIGVLLVRDFQQIVQKKFRRAALKVDSSKKTFTQLVRWCLSYNKSLSGTEYQKIMVKGDSHIYFTHPVHKHADYNKARLFPKNDKTLRLMKIFNALTIH